MLQLVKNIDDTGQKLSEKTNYFEDCFNNDGYKVPIHKLGAKLFADVQFPAEMNDSEIGKMTRLAKLMVADTNMLGYRAKGGILAYTEDYLIQIIGLHPKRGKQFFEKMIRLGLIQKNIRIIGDIKSEEYYINPAYFFAGRRIGLSLYLLFREHLNQILPGWVRREFLQAANGRVDV
jgi:hypothetical protein